MYKCRKCKAVVSSKCIYQRSIFPMDDENDKERPVQMAFMVGNVMSFKGHEDDYPVGSPGHDQGLKKYSLELRWYYPSGDTTEERVLGVLKSIRALSDRVMEIYACDHDYYIMVGEECDFGCCKGRKSRAKKKKPELEYSQLSDTPDLVRL